MRIPDEQVRARLAAPFGQWNSAEGLRDAAVLAVLVEREGADHLLFNVRRDDLPWHAGQICFPGGAREGAEEADACAVRETCEENGLDPEDLSVLGRLPDRDSIHGFRVAPFVARLAEPRPYAPQEDEVAEVFEVPCAALLDADSWSHTERRGRRIPCFQHGTRNIWGLTGLMLSDLVQRLLP